MAEAPYRMRQGYLLLFLFITISTVHAASFAKRSVDEVKDAAAKESPSSAEARMPRNLLNRNIKSPGELESLKARLRQEPELVPAMKRMAR